MLDVTHWTQEDLQIAFLRACRPGADARAVAAVLRRSQEGDRKDADVMQRWQGDRQLYTGWGSLTLSPSDSAQCDIVRRVS